MCTSIPHRAAYNHTTDEASLTGQRGTGPELILETSTTLSNKKAVELEVDGISRLYDALSDRDGDVAWRGIAVSRGLDFPRGVCVNAFGRGEANECFGHWPVWAEVTAE